MLPDPGSWDKLKDIPGWWMSEAGAAWFCGIIAVVITTVLGIKQNRLQKAMDKWQRESTEADRIDKGIERIMLAEHEWSKQYERPYADDISNLSSDAQRGSSYLNDIRDKHRSEKQRTEEQVFKAIDILCFYVRNGLIPNRQLLRPLDRKVFYWYMTLGESYPEWKGIYQDFEWYASDLTNNY